MGTEKDRRAGRTPEAAGGNRALPYLCAFLTGAAMALAWGAVYGALHLEQLFPNTAARRLFSRPVTVQIALYGLLSPFLEEIVFRGVLFDLARKVMKEKIAAVLVSALFAVWHGNPAQMLYAFPAGMILQVLRGRSGGMAEPVLCHMGANLTAIAVTMLAP